MDAFAPYIVFHSDSEFYDKEKSGVKPNTIRSITDEAMQWKDLSLRDGVLYQKDKPITKIVIVNKDGYGSFIRDLTDVSYYDFRYIFSWDPSEHGPIYETKRVTVKAAQWDGTPEGVKHIKSIFPEVEHVACHSRKHLHLCIKQPDETRSTGYRMRSISLCPLDWLVYCKAIDRYDRRSDEEFNALCKPTEASHE